MIITKQWITEEECKQAQKLINICNSIDKLNMRVVLNSRIKPETQSEDTSGEINNFLFYEDGMLVGFLWLYGFWGVQAEMSVAVHPDYRQNGIFNKLFSEASKECKRRNITRLLIIAEPKSTTAIEVIKPLGTDLISTEYKMNLNKSKYLALNKVTSNGLTLRAALESDGYEVARQNAIYFRGFQEGDEEDFLNDIPKSFDNTFMAELAGKVIGKVHLIKSDSNALICGLGILPIFRHKGYGRQVLRLIVERLLHDNIENISLEVESKNDNALNLYTSCGFEVAITYNYYLFHIN